MKNDRDLHTVTGIALQNLSNLLSGPQRLLSIGPRAGQPGKEAGYLGGPSIAAGSGDLLGPPATRRWRPALLGLVSGPVLFRAVLRFYSRFWRRAAAQDPENSSSYLLPAGDPHCHLTHPGWASAL